MYRDISQIVPISGAEIALAVLPLLISDVEHFHSISRPLRRWINYNQERKQFQDELLCHQTNFSNECYLLLISVTGWEEAEAERS